MNHARLIATRVLMLALGMAPGVVAGATYDPRVPIPMSDESTAPVPTRLLSPTAACNLEPGLLSTTSYAFFSPDAFTSLYWRVPAPCAACGPGQPLDLKTVAIEIRWQGPCSAQAEVSLVGSTGPSGCRVPNPDQVLCGPVIHPLVGTATGGTIHTLDAPAGCCAPQNAFVRIRLIGLDACPTSPTGATPGIYRTTAACVPCDQYVTTAVALPSLTDWCALQPTLFSLWVQIGADCCTAVGVDPGEAPRPGSGIVVLGTSSRRVRLAVTLAGPGPRPVEIDAFDIGGRRVRAVLRDVLDGGRHVAEWDGLSDSGSRLPPGVYKLRLRDGAARAVATAVLLD
jgi:hypothetical protein